MAIKSPNYSQYPNEILDEWMSKLSGSSFKVLSKIVRNTFGWQKEKDKISITQIKEATGLSRSQVIESIKELELLDLVESKKESGKTTEFNLKIEPVQNIDRLETEPVQKIDPPRPESKPVTRPKNRPTKESNKEINKRNRRILPKSKDEVIQYAKDNNITNVDINFFWKYFTESGWVDGQGKKVYNWKLKFLTWHKKNSGLEREKSANQLLDEMYGTQKSAI